MSVSTGCCANHCIALKRDHTLVAFGENTLGQTNVPDSAVPAVAVAVGTAHGMAIRLPPPKPRISISSRSLSLSFLALSGRMYSAEYTSDLQMPNWAPIGNPVQADDVEISIPDANALDFASRRFYRIKESPLP
jgi:hypothetical protein